MTRDLSYLWKNKQQNKHSLHKQLDVNILLNLLSTNTDFTNQTALRETAHLCQC